MLHLLCDRQKDMLHVPWYRQKDMLHVLWYRQKDTCYMYSGTGRTKIKKVLM